MCKYNIILFNWIIQASYVITCFVVVLRHEFKITTQFRANEFGQISEKSKNIFENVEDGWKPRILQSWTDQISWVIKYWYRQKNVYKIIPRSISETVWLQCLFWKQLVDTRNSCLAYRNYIFFNFVHSFHSSWAVFLKTFYQVFFSTSISINALCYLNDWTMYSEHFIYSVYINSFHTSFFIDQFYNFIGYHQYRNCL